MVTSNANNISLTNINDKLLEILTDRCKLASHLLSLLHKITDPEHASQAKLGKNPDSNNVRDFLISKPTHLIYITICYRSVIYIKRLN